MITVVVTLSLLGAPAEADPGVVEDGRIDFFEKKIRPVLIEHCYGCHSASAKDVRGGLRLDSRAGVRRGGDSGLALVPGKPDESLLLAALRHGDLKMPPDDKLPEHVIDDFDAWIAMGAPDPRDDEPAARARGIDIASARKTWAFRPLLERAGRIDELVDAKRAEKSLKENPAADKPTLLRRLFFDLTGLPPEPADVVEFLSDMAPDAYERIVDRLLASPRFGERWGRHWLDLVQYADSLDAERIFPNRGAWRYRDYVIRVFNEDRPIDHFIVEQIAGDLLPYTSDAERAEQIVATQFLTLGPMNLVNQYKAQLRMDIVDNQVDKIGRVFVGVSFGCARCHDHKFDPVALEDYYALAGILQNVQVLNGFRGVSGVFSDWLRQPIPESANERIERERLTALHQARTAEIEAQLAAKRAELERLVAAARDSARDLARDSARDSAESSAEQDEASSKLKSEVSKLEKTLRDHVKANAPRPPTVLAAMEPARPTNTRITIRGNARQLGAEVARGMPRLLSAAEEIPGTASGRLELARSLVDRRNPVVARVFVNRVWHHLFGTGIVRTVDNFGARGEAPSHPELLDALAQRFVAGGWRLKSLVREIVLSRTYRLSSAHNHIAWSIDPDNRFLWRHTPRRLDAESIRDSILKISGSLSAIAAGPTLPPAEWNTQEVAQFDQISNTKGVRTEVLQARSVFLPVSRAALRFDAGDPLRQFDFPSPNDIVGARQSSIVPTQSLYLLNSPFASKHAREFADRLLAESKRSDAERINRIYLFAFGRPGRAEEIQEGLEFLAASQATAKESASAAAEGANEADEEKAALTRLCHAVLISTEFLLHD